MAETHLNQRFAVLGQSSVFNLKEAYNNFLDRLEHQGFKNILRNPDLTGITVVSGVQQPEAWETNGGVDLLNPVFVNPHAGTVELFFPSPGQFIRQDISAKLELDTPYAVVIRVSNQGTLRLNISGGTADIYNPDDLLQTDKAEINIPPVPDGTFQNVLLRFRTRVSQVSGARFNDAVRFTIDMNDTTAFNATFEDIIAVRGEISFEGVEPQNVFLDNVRYNSDATAGYFELSNDGGNSWGQVWTNGQQFNDHVAALIDSELTGVYLSKDDVSGAGGITVTPISDGTNWSIIIDGGGITGGGGGGLGDWTKEDVIYQTILEHSDYQVAQYDIFLDGTSVNGQVTGFFTATHVSGDSRWDGGNGSAIETQDLVPSDNTDTLYSFFLYHVDLNGLVSPKYSVDGGANWYDATSNAINNVTAGFTQLLIRFEFTGIDSIYSYGVFFKPNAYVGISAKNFLEYRKLDATGTTETIMVLPNNRWYTKDGKSLEIYNNRVRLIEGIDYNEYDVGVAGTSNTVEFLIDLQVDDELIFSEFYGQVDISQDNKEIFQVQHFSDGRHAKYVSSLYVNDATGNDNYDGLTEETPKKTLAAALGKTGWGWTQINITDDSTYTLDADWHIMNSHLAIVSTGAPATIVSDCYDEGGEDKWHGFYLYNSSFRIFGCNLVMAEPLGGTLNNSWGFIKRNAGSSGHVSIETGSITLNSVYFARVAAGDFISFGFRGVSIFGTTGDGLVELAGDNASASIMNHGSTLNGVTWDGIIDGVQYENGSPLNLVTNIKELAYFIDESTGLKYQLKVDNGQMYLKLI